VLVGRRLGAGWRLTEAALEAGFTDSSHLSRSFRELFGMAPSDVLPRMRIIVGNGDKGAGAPASPSAPERL
jgi:AraC-like DNA-binding protein